MYLVLTALLALNVSAEILNAFKTVDSSLNKTNTTVSNSTATILKSFEDKLTDPTTAAKARIWQPKAQQAAALSKDMYDYIETLRNKILLAADFNPKEKGDSTFKEDNQDIATRIMVEQGEGKKLQQMLENYRKSLLAIDPIVAQELGNSLQVNTEMPAVQNKSNKTWETAYFYMVPTVAAMTMLRKFQNDVRTSENRVVGLMHEQVGKVQVRFDTYNAIVGQNSTYLMPGQEIEIMAGVGAFSKAALPKISINGQTVAIGEDGAAHAKFAAGPIGNRTVPVRIEYTDQEGKPQVITKNVEYTVGQANASIALDKMNVLYVGVDNPVTIAASGGGDDRISVNIQGGAGSIRKVSAGKYIARVGSVTDDCRISVSVDGKVAGVSQFRVRTIPRPIAVVGTYESGSNVPAGAFRAQAGVGAGIKDFPFELQYRVTRFVISADSDDGYIDDAPCQGNTWSAEARRIISNLKPGKTVTIDDIYAQGPDGRNQKLPSLVYYIK